MKTKLTLILLLVSLCTFAQQKIHTFSSINLEFKGQFFTRDMETRVFENYGNDDTKMRIYGVTTQVEDFIRINKWVDKSEAYGVRYKEAMFYCKESNEYFTIKIHSSAHQIDIIDVKTKDSITLYTSTD